MTSEGLARLIRTSETGTFRRCLLKWYLTFYRGFQGERINPAFWLGTLVHLALSEWYLKHTADPASLFYDLATESLALHQVNLIDTEGNEIEFEQYGELMASAELGVSMLEGYQEWSAENDDFATIDSELSYYLDLKDLGGRKFTYVARFDLLTEDSEGIRVRDFKTAKDFRAQTTVEYDQQFRRYPWIITQAHPDWAKDVRGSAYVGLRKIAPSARSKPPYFLKINIDLNENALREIGREVIVEATAILNLETELDRGADPRNVIFPNPTFNCAWDCDYFKNGMCHSWREGNDLETIALLHGSWDNDQYSDYREGEVNAQTVGRLE